MKLTTDEIVHIACVLLLKGQTDTCERIGVKFSTEIKRRAPERYFYLVGGGRIYPAAED